MSLHVLKRRGWLTAAVATAAAVSGGGLAWWHARQLSQQFSNAEAAFWQQQFVRLDGTTLAVADFRTKPLLLNFWATWCPPCVEELPLLNAFFNENLAKSWQVLGLAVDQSAPVNRFLARAPLSFPVALAGFSGIELSQSLGNGAGALPFSVLFKSSGHVLHRKIGKLTRDDLTLWGHALQSES